MATKYVATGGSNGAAGDIGTPWLTPTYAATQVGPGDTVYLRGGTFGVMTLDGSSVSGTSGSRITMLAYPSESVTLERINIVGNRRYWNFQDCAVGPYTGGAEISVGGGESAGAGSGFIRFTNINLTGNDFYDESAVNWAAGSVGSNEWWGGSVHDADWPITHDRPAAHGFYVSCPNNLIDGCEIYHVAQYGIHNYSDNPASNIYRNNWIHDCGKADLFTTFGIGLFTGDNCQAYNNIVSKCKNGIDIGLSADNALVYNNTVYGCAVQVTYRYPAIRFESGTGHENKNNLVYGNDDNTIDTSGATVTSATNQTTDPSFTNGGGSYNLVTDFQLQSGSSAKNAGTTLAGVTTDRAGVSRPQGAAYDIGAYEFVESGSGLGPLTADRNKLVRIHL